MLYKLVLERDGARGPPECVRGIEDIQGSMAEAGLTVQAPGRLFRIAVPHRVAVARRVSISLKPVTKRSHYFIAHYNARWPPFMQIAHAPTYAGTRTAARIHPQTCMDARARAHARTCTCMHTHAHTHMHTDARTRARAHTHTHTLTHSSPATEPRQSDPVTALKSITHRRSLQVSNFSLLPRSLQPSKEAFSSLYTLCIPLQEDRSKHTCGIPGRSGCVRSRASGRWRG
jgi:hypothetical protein